MFDISSIVCPLIAVFQQIIDAFWSAINVGGILGSVPSISSLLTGLVTCTTTTG